MPIVQIVSENFCSHYFFDLLHDSSTNKTEYFYDENGAIIKTIKVEPSNHKPRTYSRPRLIYDLIVQGLKPRKIRIWDNNYDWENLEKLGYWICSKPLTRINRWIPNVMTQVDLFKADSMPKGWKRIGRIPTHHKLRIDEANFEMQLVGPNVNPQGYSKWYKIVVPEEYQEQVDEYYRQEEMFK